MGVAGEAYTPRLPRARWLPLNVGSFCAYIRINLFVLWSSFRWHASFLSTWPTSWQGLQVRPSAVIISFTTGWCSGNGLWDLRASRRCVWRQQVPPKRRYPSGKLYSVTFQKTVALLSISIWKAYLQLSYRLSAALPRIFRVFLQCLHGYAGLIPSNMSYLLPTSCLVAIRNCPAISVNVT
jgi:hypothetical protein